MKLIKNILRILLLGIAGTILLIVALPFLVIILPVTYFQRKQFEKIYARFLVDNDGKNFFCYNNRKNSQDFIEKEIIPNLESGTEVIFLNGSIVESKLQHKFISEALYRLSHYRKFPHLMKFRDGKVLDKSINNAFYNVLNMKQSKFELLSNIDEFFNH